MWDSYLDFVETVLGGDHPIGPLSVGQVAAQSAVVFLLGVIVVRFGKSRMITRASALDAILGFTLGSLLGRGITGTASISGTTMACAVLVGLHWLLTLWAGKYHWFGDLVKGRERLLVHDGQVQMDALRHAHLSMHNLKEALRLHAGTDDLNEIQAAYKERSGEVGVVKRKREPRIVEVQVQEGVQTVRIQLEG